MRLNIFEGRKVRVCDVVTLNEFDERAKKNSRIMD